MLIYFDKFYSMTAQGLVLCVSTARSYQGYRGIFDWTIHHSCYIVCARMRKAHIVQICVSGLDECMFVLVEV